MGWCFTINCKRIKHVIICIKKKLPFVQNYIGRICSSYSADTWKRLSGGGIEKMTYWKVLSQFIILHVRTLMFMKCFCRDRMRLLHALCSVLDLQDIGIGCECNICSKSLWFSASFLLRILNYGIFVFLPYLGQKNHVICKTRV